VIRTGIQKDEVIAIRYLNSDHLVADCSNSVYDINISRDGRIYVPCYRHNKVAVFDSALVEISQIQDILTPHGVGVDTNGYIYVATYKNGRILKFDRKLKEIPGWDGQVRRERLIDQPVAVATDEHNDVYAADYFLGSIVKINSEGRPLNVFNGAGDCGGKIMKPHGLCTDGNNFLYAADRGTAKAVHVFDLEGRHISTWGSSDKKQEPLTVKVFDKKTLMVPDYSENAIRIFEPDGKETAVIGAYGPGPGEFLNVMSLVDAGKGCIVTVEQDGNRMQKVNLGKIIERLYRIETDGEER